MPTDTLAPPDAAPEAGALLAAELALEFELLLPHAATTKVTTTSTAALPIRILALLQLSIMVLFHFVKIVYAHRGRVMTLKTPRTGDPSRGGRGQAGTSWRSRPAASPNTSWGTRRHSSRMSGGVQDPAAPCIAPTASGKIAASM